jgi:thiol reductant ABC exporter CydD subunit
MKPLDPQLLHHARASRLFVAATVLVGAATAVLIVAQASLLSHEIAGRTLDGVGLLVGVVLARAALVWVGELVAFRSSAEVKTVLRAKALQAAAARGASYASGSKAAEITTTLTRGLDALDGYFSRYLPQLFLAVIVPVVVLVRIAAADWLSAVIIAVTLPLIPIFMILVGMAARRHMQAQWRTLVQLSTHFLDVVEGLTTLRLFGRARAAADSVRRVTDDYRRVTMSTLRVAFLSALVLELLSALSVGLVAVSIGLRLVDGHLTYEAALLVLLLAPEAYLPLRQVGVHYHASIEGAEAAEGVFAMIDDAPTPAEQTEQPVQATVSRPDVRTARLWLDDVTVRYDDRHRPALDQVSFAVEPGECVALVGASGAGKSTALALLLRMVDPATGDVRVGGAALSQLPVDWWRSQVAWVPQHPHLYVGSVADNIRLGRPAASDAQVRRAAAQASAADFIDELPGGYGHRLGDGATTLSAGQRQRLGLARAFLREAPLLLLDEPTENLDPQSQAAVLDAIARVRPDCTIVLVAHRMPLARLADRLVVLEEGRVAQSGPPASLDLVPGPWRSFQEALETLA